MRLSGYTFIPALLSLTACSDSATDTTMESVDHTPIVVMAGGLPEFFAEGSVLYYQDEARQCFAINAAREEYRTGFAAAKTRLSDSHSTGEYRLVLTTIPENDGESSYRILINGQLVETFVNPATEAVFSEAVFTTQPVSLQPGDTIRVESIAHTNGKIPEGDETAWARGRWTQLVAVMQ